MASYRAISQGIEVEVEPSYIADQSSPELNYFFFAYRVRIVNNSSETVQLVQRHWIIVDGHRRAQEVRGDGVVGQQPYLKPGDRFEYSSFCPLPTPTGNMRGSYRMKTLDDRIIEVTIPVFFLRDYQHGESVAQP